MCAQVTFYLNYETFEFAFRRINTVSLGILSLSLSTVVFFFLTWVSFQNEVAAIILREPKQAVALNRESDTGHRLKLGLPPKAQS